MKATAVAPSNIAFIKYWGKKDDVLRLPENGSLSMNLSNLTTTTTVEFSTNLNEDYVEINGTQEPSEGSRAVKHLDRVRNLAKIETKAKVITNNTFPSGTGLSSSASGFAALTVAAAKAAGLKLSEKELSILARQGSGSACRSIPNGFVEWLDGETSDTSYAISLHPPDWWDLVDIVAIVSDEKKDVSSTAGQKLVYSSPFFQVRLTKIKEKLEYAKSLLKQKSFQAFGELLEAEALELHAIMLTSTPSLIYWMPGTIQVMKFIKKVRNDGLPVYFTVNTGQDIHLICEKQYSKEVVQALNRLDCVKQVIENNPSDGAKIVK